VIGWIITVVPMWIGHAVLWTWLLNNLYGRKINKRFLQYWRLLTGVVILFGIPALAWLVLPTEIEPTRFQSIVSPPIAAYLYVCQFFGMVVFPLITIWRLTRPAPRSLISQKTETTDYWKEMGPSIGGRGKWWWMARVPFTCAFKVDFTELVLKLPNLPKAWDGLTILHLSDFHFHGTPARSFFERLFRDVKTRWPSNDLVVLTGDYIDTDSHVTWIRPLLEGFEATETRLAILGNHDKKHHPDDVRRALQSAGYGVISNRWDVVTIRGESCAVVGHEGPWLGPPPGPCPTPELPKLCLMHSPDNIYWAAREGCQLAFAGHVHGGQVRLPVIGPIFVPSIYSRRFDSGVFDVNGTTLVISRGLSGKEPLRFRCNPQVVRVTLRVE
jgi:predicted MPP superfamily phosphohydrolase